MAHRGGMQEVELLDGDETVTGQPDVPARPRRVRRRWVAAGVVVVAVALVGTQLVADARERAAVARLAAAPGAFPAVGDELATVRTVPPEQEAMLWGGVGIGPAQAASLVVAEDGSQAVDAIDLRTGATLWSVALLGPDADRAAERDNSYSGGCVGDTAPGVPATVAVCLVTDGFVTYDADGVIERRPATSSEVVVLDAGDGHVLSRWNSDPDAQVVALDGLTVAGTRRADGGIEVVAHDVATGAQRWRHVRPATEPGAVVGPQSWTLSRVGDLVGVVDGGALTLLSPTGAVVREDLETADGGFTFDTDPRTGRFSITRYSSTGAQTTTLLAPDGAPDGDLTVKGDLVRLVVDDGSVPGLVLTRFVHLHGWDRTTRDELWEANVGPAYAAIVARGLVYLTTSTEVIALDGRTGAVEWRVSVPLVGSATVATDGRDLLVLSVPDGIDGRMTGYDLATGERTREVTYPDGVSDVQLMHGVLVGWASSTETVTVLE